MTAWVVRLATEPAGAHGMFDALSELLDGSSTAITLTETAPDIWAVEICGDSATGPFAVREAVRTVAGEQAASNLQFMPLPQKDWVALSLAGLAPVRAGRFIIHGAHDRAHVPPNAIGIEIEAALAFGTGHHGTTRGCLLALESFLKKRRRSKPRVLDVGTGTGVLAIAAARALKCTVIAGDIDLVSVRTARVNARANRAGNVIALLATGLNTPGIRSRAPYDLVFANILLVPLTRLAVPIARVTARGGTAVLSGLLLSHANAAMAAYAAQGFQLERRIAIEGWCTLILRRPSSGRVNTLAGFRGRCRVGGCS